MNTVSRLIIGGSAGSMMIALPFFATSPTSTMPALVVSVNFVDIGARTRAGQFGRDRRNDLGKWTSRYGGNRDHRDRRLPHRPAMLTLDASR